MQLDQILRQQHTRCRLTPADKSAALDAVAQLLAGADTGLDAATVAAGLAARERLGSTGLGDGIAIPHCRLKAARHIAGALITLTEPIEFDAMDDEPVDILFALIAPEDAAQAHLNTLAALAERFSQASFRQQLRDAGDDSALLDAALTFKL
ncbi:MAG: PTS sugar transporter subunit IIA [Spongiibacteraceae bacterium]